MNIKTVIFISALFLSGCFPEEDYCDEKYLAGYETIISEDGSSVTTKAIYKCGTPEAH